MMLVIIGSVVAVLMGLVMRLFLADIWLVGRVRGKLSRVVMPNSGRRQ
jgi:hypothetical protein